MAVPYGFITLRDLVARRVTEVGVGVVVDAVNASVAEHNRVVDALFSSLVRRTTDFKTRFRTSTAARLQGLTERGRAEPIQPLGQYDVSIPLQAGGIAWGFTDVAAAKMTVGDVQEATDTLLMADLRWLRDHILAALFVDGSWTFDDPEHGALTVYGPASGDTTVYNILAGADNQATDDHVKGSATVTAAVFTDIKSELLEHPENGGDVVVLVPTASRATVEGLAGFYPVSDSNILLPSTTGQLSRIPQAPVPGEYFGYINGCFVVEWRSFPANYLIGFTTEGEAPLAMREDPEEELRGFKEVGRRDDHPWYERQWRRRAGFGAWNRVGAITYRTDNATFATPTGYASPMK